MDIPFDGPYLKYTAPNIHCNDDLIDIYYIKPYYASAYILVYKNNFIGESPTLELAKKQRAEYNREELIANYKDHFIEEALNFPGWLVSIIKEKKELKRLKTKILLKENSKKKINSKPEN